MRYEELSAIRELRDLLDDHTDIALATARMLTAGERRYSLDEVLALFGYTREQLRDLPE